MVETTQDILLLAKSFGILWVSIFFGLLFFYLAMMVRQAYRMMQEMRDRFNKVDTIIKDCYSKMDAGMSGFIYVADGVKLLVDTLKKRNIIKTKEKAKKK
ncbi:hypothetical protein ISS03_01020 [Patescibacteria group bacterium]|nr:hypothetical protein [Patescibacteria group bacterium]